jgi:hypothetical protein
VSGKSAVISVAITGEAKSATKAFDAVAKSADGMRDSAKDAGKGFDGLRDGADDTERRIVGFRDSLTGTGDVMKGLRDGDMITLATGFADLSSSVANLGADMLEYGKKAVSAVTSVTKASIANAAASVKDTAAMIAHKAASIASTVATQAMAAAQWLLNAAMTANPIGLVVVALAALAAGFVLAWQHSETFREVVTGAFDTVKGVIVGAYEWVRDNWPLLLGILTGPIGLAVLAITRNWDTIKEGFATAVGWISTRVDELVGFFTGLPSRITTAAAGAFVGLYNSFAGTLNSIIRAWNDFELGFSFAGKDMPGPIPDVPGFSLTIPTPDMPMVPMLAAGGIVTDPTLAMIGEAGPEAVVPLPRAGELGGTVILEAGAIQIGRAGPSEIRELEAMLERLKRRNSPALRGLAT